jgi:hydrogenase-4 membrane subunit HyfE
VTQGGWVAPAIAGALILVILGLYALTGKDRAARIAGYVESEDSRPNPDV